MKKLIDFIKTLSFNIWVFLATKTSDKKIKQLFSRFCELDLREPMFVGDYTLYAGGSTVEIVTIDSHYSLNEVMDRKLGVYKKDPSNPVGWSQVYRSYEILEDMSWYPQMLDVAEQLEAQNFFFTRQKQLLLESV